MKVTKAQLQQIIKEEVEGMLRESGIQAYAPGHPISRHDEDDEDKETELYGDQEGLAEEEDSFSKAGEEIEKKGTEGVFTSKAKKDGMGVQAYADKVLAKGSNASTKTKKQAGFAKGAATVAKNRKKQD